ncbi:MAG: GNAT family N-acetyltransferase [Nitrospirae bacterium]|nr:GNAT family N-acetyltransferase [Nitrospirota bacterium]
MNEVQSIKLKNGSAVTLRPAKGEDAKGIVETIRSSSEERSSLILEMHGKHIGSERKFIERLDRDNNLLLIAVSDDKVVGCLAAFKASEWEDRLARAVEIGLHLRDGYRGGGLGSAMLSYAVEWAKSKGFKKMMMSIYTNNKRSASLFTRQGFSEVAAKNIQTSSSSLNKIILMRPL